MNLEDRVYERLTRRAINMLFNHINEAYGDFGVFAKECDITKSELANIFLKLHNEGIIRLEWYPFTKDTLYVKARVLTAREVAQNLQGGTNEACI
jgi:hypothetical protein